LVLFVGKKDRTRSRQEDKIKIKKKVKFEITFGNKKEANIPSQGILPQYGDPHWG
jgi:hypothetical protein